MMDYEANQINHEQFEEARQELHWDIAWEIFDEINKFNDTEKHINLACLSVEDAIPITKQKIYEVAQLFGPH